eukprot:m.18063 g.18063  ORF g.18063 m.18063 type:complete len:491 (-) comp3561_c0_seq1:59-1531(-)
MSRAVIVVLLSTVVCCCCMGGTAAGATVERPRTRVTAPNTSLATVPVGYFGGNAGHRDDASIAMLAKARIVMLEKWEGHCWQDCLNDPSSTACLPQCDVESLILDTMQRIKAINPSVSCILYLNTLLDFPFYKLHGTFLDAGLDVIDSTTHEPIRIVNDNGMKGIYVFGYDKPAGVQMYVEAIKNYTSTGLVDGFFGDKWSSAATQNNKGQWQICNHECGNVTAEQGQAWNAGKLDMLKQVTQLVGDGPYFANGGQFEGFGSNFFGHWSTAPYLKRGDPRDGIADVTGLLINHTYVYCSSTGDQHWTTDPNDPASLQGQCVGDCLARFLLLVEEGVFLGTNGWDETYELPLGNPLGPAVYTDGSPATLHRNFSSGTYVVFTYDASGKDGTGVVYWEGKPPAPPPPPPPPAMIQCGAYRSSMMNDTTFAYNDVTAAVNMPSYMPCCEACGQHATCVAWAWHADQQGACHLHGNKSQQKAHPNTVAGVLMST